MQLRSSLSSEQQARDEVLRQMAAEHTEQDRIGRQLQELMQLLSAASAVRSLAASEFEAKLRAVAGQQDSAG